MIFPWVYRHNNPQLIDQSERSHWFGYYIKDSKQNSLHLARKYARIFVPGHYLFLEAHSFPLLGTDNVPGQISQQIFAPYEGYCLHIQRTLVE